VVSLVRVEVQVKKHKTLPLPEKLLKLKGLGAWLMWRVPDLEFKP
jgi:hypothetical protein